MKNFSFLNSEVAFGYDRLLVKVSKKLIVTYTKIYIPAGAISSVIANVEMRLPKPQIGLWLAGGPEFRENMGRRGSTPVSTVLQFYIISTGLPDTNTFVQTKMNS